VRSTAMRSNNNGNTYVDAKTGFCAVIIELNKQGNPTMADICQFSIFKIVATAILDF